MSAYDEFKLKGREEYAEYRYYKGEDECPYYPQSIEASWWDFEKRYHDGARKKGKWKDFSDYFDSWVRDRAAPETGWDLAKGNRWRKEYEENAPF
jgi:hypothetical protein